MNARVRWAVFFGLTAAGSLAGAAAGCGGDTGGTGGRAEKPRECPQTPAATKASPSNQFRDEDRDWIVKDSAKLCAPAPGPKWQGRHLFSQASPGKLGLNGTLATYCVYHWSDATTVPGPMDLLQLPMLPRARDRRAITPQGPGTVEAWAHDTFIAGIHGPAQSTPALKVPRVRVIVADTEQDSIGPGNGGTTPGTNMHGSFLAKLVSEVACPTPGACAVDVETRLALPLRRTSGNGEETVVTGGDFGRLSDLVGAIDRSLKDWRTEILTNKPFPPMLALSLSLAFEKQTSVPPGESFSADEVVLDALKAFSCHGGAIFAAAGNHGGQDSTDLLYPAHWQEEPEPTDEQCALLFNSAKKTEYGILQALYSAGLGGKLPLRRAYIPSGKKVAEPGYLLHAIGAFDQGGIPIKKTRENACPRFGALGLGWSVDSPSHVLFTGTSVPTAVVSAFFAAAMAQTSFTGFQQSFQDPYLTAHPQTILDQLAKMSPSQPFEASGPCGNEWSCPSIPWIGGPASASALASATKQNEDSHFPWLDYTSQGVVDGGAGEDNNCTTEPRCERKGASAIAVVYPQPNEPPCPRGCFLDLTNYRFLIDPAMKMTDVKLTIDTGTRQIIDITAVGQDLIPGTIYRFQLDATQLANAGTARLSVSALAAGNTASVSDQVLLVQNPVQ